MKRTLMIAALAALWSIVLGAALAQQRPQPQRGQQRQRQAQSQAQLQAQPAKPLYQRRDTWYEFLLKQFNPDNLDYGTWIEQRRQAFLEARVRNPHFGYSLGATLALLLMTAVYAKLWIDHRRAMWITAEMMADVYNHDQYSREVAKEAIQRYNQHIERCNRAIEAAGQGTAMPGTDVNTEPLKVELERVGEERDRYLRERDTAKAELATNAKILADMSLRLDGMSKKPGTNAAASQSVDLRTTDPSVVKHINNLQEQLYAERRENKRLKGA